jgi:ABC-type transport system involved in cytochrome bd biosynthesis fused ATPase/permease subunit
MEQRLDRFYTWAEQVQVELRKLHAVHAENEELRQEIRNLKQRVGFLEAILQNEFNFAPSSAADQDLVRQLEALTRSKFEHGQLQTAAHGNISAHGFCPL